MKPIPYKQALIAIFLVFFSTSVLGAQKEAKATQPSITLESLQNLGELNEKLFFAIKTNDYEIISDLISKGADPNLQNNNGESLLHLAVQFNHADSVEALLNHESTLIDIQDNRGRTPLYVSLEYQNTDITQILLRAGADPNIADNEGFSPLYLAAEWGEINEVKQLIEAGAKINSRTKDGWTVLHASTGYPETLQFLIEKGAELNSQDLYGQTPLHFASLFGHTDSVKILIANKARLNIQAHDGQTPLHIAVIEYEAYYLSKLALEIREIEMQKYLDIIYALLAGGASRDIPDNTGQTVRDIAENL